MITTTLAESIERLTTPDDTDVEALGNIRQLCLRHISNCPSREIDHCETCTFAAVVLREIPTSLRRQWPLMQEFGLCG